ncbi:MAG: hypothetical protein AAB368_03410 [bacterium]
MDLNAKLEYARQQIMVWTSQAAQAQAALAAANENLLKWQGAADYLDGILRETLAAAAGNGAPPAGPPELKSLPDGKAGKKEGEEGT